MKFHILVVADGRSPTARSWIKNIQLLGYQVSLISTFPCEPMEGLLHLYNLPVAFSHFSGKTNQPKASSSTHRFKKLLRRFSPFFQKLRYRLGPLTILRFAWTYQRLVKQIEPDLVHALRIPFEGMLGSYTPASIPFLAAIWGNDLTLHASGSYLMKWYTRRCLQRADGLSADTQRDIRLAQQWGFDLNLPSLVVPGSGGLDVPLIQNSVSIDTEQYGIKKSGIWVVNPRGLRPGSVHQDVFFTAVSKVVALRSDVQFICPSLGGKKMAEIWVEKLGIEKQVFLLPQLSQQQLWGLFNHSEIFVSPSSHDGTPNSFLEAIACGCFPIVGDIESLREWIVDEENGLLVDPCNPDELANAIIKAIDHPDLRQKAANLNLTLVNQKASKRATLPKIDDFYQQFLN